LRGHHDPAVAVGAMDQRGRPRLAGRPALGAQQQDRRPAPVIAPLAAGLPIDAHVLGTEQIVVWARHRAAVYFYFSPFQPLARGAFEDRLERLLDGLLA